MKQLCKRHIFMLHAPDLKMVAMTINISLLNPKIDLDAFWNIHTRDTDHCSMFCFSLPAM